ncbi:MAG: hypothetical protein PHY34_03650 [Patescibacteria group bacterium]|nr:hypothetical protein [Patescibacteria group bacterium]MDD5716014.1 hypothetical protein [Patescibacteria group bacterium]
MEPVSSCDKTRYLSVEALGADYTVTCREGETVVGQFRCSAGTISLIVYFLQHRLLQKVSIGVTDLMVYNLMRDLRIEHLDPSHQEQCTLFFPGVEDKPTTVLVADMIALLGSCPHVQMPQFWDPGMVPVSHPQF